MRNHPFPTRPAHSFCRAARGSWQIFEEAQELRSTDKLPQGAALSPSSRCSRHRRWGRHLQVARSAAFSADLELDTVLALVDVDWCKRHACSRWERRRRAGKGMPHESRAWRLCMRLMYRFFRTFFVGMSAGLRVCAGVPDGYVERPWDLDSDSLWAALVACVQHISRGLFACARAAAHRPRQCLVAAQAFSDNLVAKCEHERHFF